MRGWPSLLLGDVRTPPCRCVPQVTPATSNPPAGVGNTLVSISLLTKDDDAGFCVLFTTLLRELASWFRPMEDSHHAQTPKNALRNASSPEINSIWLSMKKWVSCLRSQIFDFHILQTEIPAETMHILINLGLRPKHLPARVPPPWVVSCPCAAKSADPRDSVASEFHLGSFHFISSNPSATWVYENDARALAPKVAGNLHPGLYAVDQREAVLLIVNVTLPFNNLSTHFL